MRRSRANRLAVALSLLVLAPAACGGKARPAGGDCTKPPPGIGPDADATLQLGDTGRYCMKVGQVLTVYLRVGPDELSTRWAPPSPSDATVLETQSSGVLTPVVGVTPAVFKASAKGTTVLRASRPSGQQWQATVVVR